MEKAVLCSKVSFCRLCACAEAIPRGGSISEIDQYGLKNICANFHACIQKRTIGHIFGAMRLC